MIISHRHRFIFLKTRKTAGTSVEIALSRICGDDDVLTPVGIDAQARIEFSGRDAQNTIVPLRQSMSILRANRRRNFYNHIPARLIRASVDPKVWNEYFKFTIERDPFDRAISLYYWRFRNHVEPRPSISEWLTGARHLSNWPIYALDGEVVADHVIQYDDLTAGLALVSERLGVDIAMPERRAKGEFRSDRRHPSEMLSDEDIAFIARSCEPEIQYFGYQLP